MIHLLNSLKRIIVCNFNKIFTFINSHNSRAVENIYYELQLQVMNWSLTFQMKMSELSSSKVTITNKNQSKNKISMIDNVTNAIIKHFPRNTLLFLPLIFASLGSILLVLACVLLGSYKLHLFQIASLHFLSTPILMLLSSTLHLLLAMLVFMVWNKVKVTK